MEPNNNISTSDDGKTASIVSYLTVIGWLIAYFAMHNDKKTELGSYHLRQTLLLYIIGIGVYIVWSVVFVSLLFSTGFTLALTLNWVIRVGLFVLWIIGFIGAVNGEKKPIPIIGDMAQNMFKGI
ncbi:MAG TPA: hypothetical protein VJ844_09015 [Mucilaginibacter sp.]|nr:hypothetical protein [Mucilaginibacter sp.]